MMSLYFSDLPNQQLEFLYSKTLKLRNQLIMLEGTNHLVLFHTPETGVRSGFWHRSTTAITYGLHVMGQTQR